MFGEWILTAWGRISSESIVNGFKKCCISNALDGSENDILWEEVPDENSSTSEDSDDEDSASMDK